MNVCRSIAVAVALLVVTTLSLKMRGVQAQTACSDENPPPAIPFTDVTSFCHEIAQAFFTGLTNGTSPTTYSPTNTTTRGEMAAFITRTQDTALKRGSRRAALNQFWTPKSASALALTTVVLNPIWVQSDAADLWVSSANLVGRVRASDGRLLDAWTDTVGGKGILIAIGRVFIAGNSGNLYRIDPTQPSGPVVTVASSLGRGEGLAFDGSRIWMANLDGSVSIITPSASLPFPSVTVSTGFMSLLGILFDGANIWTADVQDSRLKKLDANGAILQSVPVGAGPLFPVFDGTNIWVPSRVANTVSVVRASTGAVLATLSGNGLNGPTTAAFDGQRVLVTNFFGDSVSLWNAADLTPLGSVSTGAGTSPLGACSDGVNFWIALDGTDKIARF